MIIIIIKTFIIVAIIITITVITFGIAIAPIVNTFSLNR